MKARARLVLPFTLVNVAPVARKVSGTGTDLTLTSEPFLMTISSAWPFVKKVSFLKRCAHKVFFTPPPCSSTAMRMDSMSSTSTSGLPFGTPRMKEFMPVRGVVAVGDALQPAAPGEIRELNREDPAEGALAVRPVTFEGLVHDLVDEDLLAVGDDDSWNAVSRRHRHVHRDHGVGEPGDLLQGERRFGARVGRGVAAPAEEPLQE